MLAIPFVGVLHCKWMVLTCDGLGVGSSTHAAFGELKSYGPEGLSSHRLVKV